MKPFQSLIPAALVITIAFTACTNTSDNSATANTDTAVGMAENTADANQEKLEANKKLVTEFYQSLYGDKDSNAVDKYVAENVIQHNLL
jgi:hypothetical protein